MIDRDIVGKAFVVTQDHAVRLSPKDTWSDSVTVRKGEILVVIDINEYGSGYDITCLYAVGIRFLRVAFPGDDRDDLIYIIKELE